MTADLAPLPTAPGLDERKRAYRLLVERIRRLVGQHVPPASTVVVVSRGDPELLSLSGRPAWHFPRDEEGRYAGHYPSSSQDAIEHLEAIRSGGGEYLLFPQTGLWWLEYYAEFAKHLQSHYPVVVRDGACVIYRLRDSEQGDGVQEAGSVDQSVPDDHHVRQLVDSLLPESAELVLLTTDTEAPALGARKVRCFTPSRGVAPFRSDEHLIAAFEALRVGADYLVVSSQALDWLHSRRELRAHITATCRQIVSQRHVCTISDLRAGKKRR